MNAMKIQAVIFDLDGTLAETVDDICTATNRMLDELKLPCVSREKVLLEVNFDSRTYIKRCLPAEAADDEQVVHQALDGYKKYYGQCFADKTYPYPGIVEIIQRMKALGKPMAVISNKLDEFTKVIIEKLFGAGYFSFIMGSGTQYPHKPDPHTANMFAQSIGIPPGQIAFVGDSETDMETANNAGMIAVGVGWGYRSEAFLIAHGARCITRTVADLDRLLKES